jgi:hypothetical protein
MQLPKEQRGLIFYSEGRNYWPHLEGLIEELLESSIIFICYISSGEDDPGLSLKHPDYRTFQIGEGFVRNWLFENLETDVMVMTMPDLNQYQLKRSKHKVHYVYVQHSLVSLHMIYRKGAFDFYDTIFCSGPHHVEEIRATEAKYDLPPKTLVEHGYGRLDSIIDEVRKRPKKEKRAGDALHILIAPSWGPDCTIESGAGEEIVDQLLENGFKVTLRPHPQTTKFAKARIDAILRKHSENNLFDYEDNVASQESLHASDVMVSDWSGAALDYAFGLGKPVIFVDTPRKVNNSDYQEIGIEPFEVSIRETIGQVLDVDNIDNIAEILKSSSMGNTENTIFNVGNSQEIGAKYIQTLHKEISSA